MLRNAIAYNAKPECGMSLAYLLIAVLRVQRFKTVICGPAQSIIRSPGSPVAPERIELASNCQVQLHEQWAGQAFNVSQTAHEVQLICVVSS